MDHNFEEYRPNPYLLKYKYFKCTNCGLIVLLSEEISTKDMFKISLHWSPHFQGILLKDFHLTCNDIIIKSIIK